MLYDIPTTKKIMITLLERKTKGGVLIKREQTSFVIQVPSTETVHDVEKKLAGFFVVQDKKFK